MKSFFKKTLILFSIAALTLPLLNIPTSFADFNDVLEGNGNYEAINYLQDTGVIKGYDDGTFKPALKVNRVEFLKIVLEGSNIDLDENENVPLSDIDNNAWYAPYVKKAYAEGWVIGYPDNTFKPTQTINKVEALKILGEVQEWKTNNSAESPFSDVPSDTWYTPYVAYAKEYGFLEENGNSFSPSGIMTRGSISEVVYRTLTNNGKTNSKNDEDIDNTSSLDSDTQGQEDNTETENNQNINFTPVSFSYISRTNFDNISLDEKLPNIFYENEVYIISGKIDSGNYDEVTVIVDDDISKSGYKTYSSDLTNNNFETAVHFPKSGNYYIGILPGNNGNTKLKEISVLPDLPDSVNTSETPDKISDLDIDHTDDKTFVSFDSENNTIKKLFFEQGSKTVSYISRQNIDEIFIDFPDFKNFKEKETTYYIESADLNSQSPLEIGSSYIKSDKKTFEAITHTFSDIKSDQIKTTPPSLLNSNQKISFSGKLKTETKPHAYVIKPNGFIETANLSSSGNSGSFHGNETLLSGSDFSFSYNPSSTGRYIVEIVDKNGFPIVNHPIYIGDYIPLIPDYFDLNTRTLYKKPLNLDSARDELLDLINQSREDHGLDPITLNEDLNDLAQAHSDDMAENDYFSHYNLEGQSPGDRRVEAGITTGVSENIGQDVSIEFAHESLMRSATHRSNILDKNWETVGLGIAKKDGYLVVTEEFSTNALEEIDLENYKQDLENKVNELRSENGVSTLNISTAMENAAENLNEESIAGETLNSELFQDILVNLNISGNTQAVGRISGSWRVILSSILEENIVISSSWKKMGINLKLDDSGNINVILLLNDHS